MASRTTCAIPVQPASTIISSSRSIPNACSNSWPEPPNGATQTPRAAYSERTFTFLGEDGMRCARIPVLFGMAAMAAGCVSTTEPGAAGVNRQQLLIVPASMVERVATLQYERRALRALEAGRLVRRGPEYARLQRIAARLEAHAPFFRADAAEWQWQLILIDAPLVNASCAPGGKISFYTGMLRQLHLSDDEIAAVIGHEIAHALREHGRERMSLVFLQEVLGGKPRTAPPTEKEAETLTEPFIHALFVAPNTQRNEIEADAIGLELAARAGYDPRATLELWRKLQAHPQQRLPEFNATHPSAATRVQDIEALLPRLVPLYEEARAARADRRV
ncbi:M48 family peptidase [Oxalobacteraceae bacterium OM1]|nr:M48 family peptidase [Oxalobacteraceae bacterium OM1]